jgi:hypothetical protein
MDIERGLSMLDNKGFCKFLYKNNETGWIWVNPTQVPVSDERRT